MTDISAIDPKELTGSDQVPIDNTFIFFIEAIKLCAA